MTARPHVPPSAVYPAKIAAVAAVYFGAAKLGLLAAVAQKVVSSAWPPSGVALAALLLLGLRYWPGIALGAFLLNWTAGVPLAGAAGIAGGNALEAVTAVWLLRRVAFRPSLERLRDVLALVILAAAVSTTLSATLGVASLWASGVVERSAVGRLWIVWWSGDALGDLFVAPVLLTWARFAWIGRRGPEAVALVLSLVLLPTLLLASPLAYVYAVFPLVVWAALRFGPRGAATATALIAAMTIWHTLQARGPFVGSTPTHNLALLQTFLTLFSITGLALAAVTTERLEAERLAREGEQRFRLLVESVQDYAIFRLDPTGRVVSWNAGAERIKGYAADEIVGRDFACFYTPDDAAAGRPAANLREAAERGRCETQGWRVRKDGSRFWADVVLAAIQDADGALVGFAKVTRDLTERRRAEQDLQRQTAFVQLLQDVAVAANEAQRVDDVLQITVEEVCRVTGWPIGHAYVVAPDTPDLLCPTEIWHQDRGEPVAPFRRATSATPLPRGVGLPGRVLASKRPAWILDVTQDTNFPRAAAARESGVRAGFAFPVLVGQDVRAVLEFFCHETIAPDEALIEVVAHIGTQLGRVIERERAAEALQQRQALLAATNAELESFSYSVSHDLRAPLRAIDGYAQVLLQDHAGALDAEGQRLLNTVRGNAQRMGQLIDALLRFSRLGRQALKIELIDMTSLARGVVEELRQAAGDSLPEVSLQALPPAVGDRTLLQQVLANLVSNACKFSRTGPRARVEIGAHLEANEAVYFVRDNGVGFDMAYADKLFQVFSRLHRPDEFEGTGVGLALVRRVIERHGGRVWAESAVNEGASFYFTLPRRTAAR